MHSAVETRREYGRFSSPGSSAAVSTPRGGRRPREAGGVTSRLRHRRVTAMMDPGGRKRGRRKRRGMTGRGETVCRTGGREVTREMESEGGVCASTREPEMISTGFLTRYSICCTSSARKRGCWHRKIHLILRRTYVFFRYDCSLGLLFCSGLSRNVPWNSPYSCWCMAGSHLWIHSPV